MVRGSPYKSPADCAKALDAHLGRNDAHQVPLGGASLTPTLWELVTRLQLVPEGSQGRGGEADSRFSGGDGTAVEDRF